MRVGVTRLCFCSFRYSSRPALILWLQVFKRNEINKRGLSCKMFDELTPLIVPNPYTVQVNNSCGVIRHYSCVLWLACHAEESGKHEYYRK